MLLKCSKFRSLLFGIVASSFLESRPVVGDEVGCCGSEEPSSADASSDDLSEEGVGQTGLAPSVIFSAPPPTGEIAGARMSLAFPSLRLSLPKITLETPELSLNGFGRSRRGAQMNIDSSSAPVSQGNPLLFGHIPTGIGQSTGTPNAPAQSTPDSGDQASPACAPANKRNCGELSSKSRRDSSVRRNHHIGIANATRIGTGDCDPWRTSSEGVEECKQQVADLSSQIQDLQVAVLKLAELQESRATSTGDTRPSRVDPWQEPSRAGVDEFRETARVQAERIAYLEAQLEALSSASGGADQPVAPPRGNAAPAATNSGRSNVATATSASRAKIFNRLGGLMSSR